MCGVVGVVVQFVCHGCRRWLCVVFDLWDLGVHYLQFQPVCDQFPNVGLCVSKMRGVVEVVHGEVSETDWSVC